MSDRLHLGFEVGTGEPVEIPLRHMVVTGQTQEAGKTTALEALIGRSGMRAIAFVTKRGEGSFHDARVIQPYFRERADWQFVASILEASRGEKLKFERAWIIRASKGATTLAEVQRNVQKALNDPKTRGMSADVYLTLDAYLEAVVPQIAHVRWASTVELQSGLNVMDMTGLNVEMQHLVIRSTIEWVLEREENTVVVVPEAWKFIPQGRGTPVKLAAESFIRQAAGLRNYLWLDSQDIAGVEKMILKSVPVWILGVQREFNEVKRTLAQIPASVKKPKPDEVATLELGEFFACYGKHTTKVYVQPAWMESDEARRVAMGGERTSKAPRKPTKHPVTEVSQVTEQEARELRATNARLQAEIDDLRSKLTYAREELEASEAKADAKPPAVSAPPTDEEGLFQRFRARLLKEPTVLRLLATKPEIELTVQRRTVEANDETLRGRLAKLVAEGFFENTIGGTSAHAELQRRGVGSAKPNVYRELDYLTSLGFLTKEEGGFRAVPGMKVNIVESR